MPAAAVSAVPLPSGLRTPALVLTDAPLDPPPGATVVLLGTPPPQEGGWASVTLVVADETALRRAVSDLPPLGRARSIAVVLREAAGPVSLVARPEWPPLREIDIRVTPAGAASTTLELARGIAVADALVELARGTGLPVPTGNGGLFLEPALRGPVDATAITDDVPATGVRTDPEPSTILSQQPVALLPLGEDGVAPLDEAVLNPRGFRPATGPVVDLDPARPVTAALVAALRDAAGVRVTWPAPEAAVAALAMAGVPLVAAPVPAASRGRLGDALADALARPVDLADPLAREVHSVHLRRAALDTHATLAWRGRLAARAGVRHAAYPSVSVVLTGPPDRLEHAREQVARQRGVEVEVVLPGDRPSGETVLRTDADGWWGPEVLLDLLRARRYSGAPVVEMPAELVWAEPIGTTLRRRLATEVSVTGREIGPGAGPLPALVLTDRAGSGVGRGAGTAYRTHGLGHVARLPAGADPTGLVTGLLRRRSLAWQWRGLQLGALVGGGA